MNHSQEKKMGEKKSKICRNEDSVVIKFKSVKCLVFVLEGFFETGVNQCQILQSVLVKQTDLLHSSVGYL